MKQHLHLFSAQHHLRHSPPCYRPFNHPRDTVLISSKIHVPADYMQGFAGNFSFLSNTSVPPDCHGNWNICASSGSSNRTDIPDVQLKHPALGILLASFSFITIFGNMLVITAVSKEIYLRTITNYFIVSLAVADLVMGAIVMPFSISYEMTGGIWFYGPYWCDLWHSFDVLASSASILNLCMISLDRYWAITDPIAYPNKMSSCKVTIMIALVWICSAGISFPAIAWWKAVTPSDLPISVCVFTEDSGYLVFSSFVSFYCPLIIMLFVYFKIYRAATAQTKSLKCGTKIMSSNGIDGEVMTLRIHRGGGGVRCRLQEESHVSSYEKSASESEAGSPAHLVHHSSEDDQPHHLHEELHCHHHGPHQHRSKLITKRIHKFAISKRLTKLAREQKAAKTLGIVVGVFIICWLPFFVCNILMGLCRGSCIAHPEIVLPVFTWLGYINSGMNPVIYALSMRDFRRAFTKILFICCPRYRYARRRQKQYYLNSQETSGFSATCVDRCIPVRI